MKLLICSIFDGAVGAYGAPFYARSKAEASRTFADACADTNHAFYKHAADYTLFSIGTFDDADGKIVQPAMHSKIITALECQSVNRADYMSFEAENVSTENLKRINSGTTKLPM